VISEERLAVYLDYENLAIGARENLGRAFDYGPVADAMAERGRVVVRRAYADWSYFSEDRRALTRQHVELLEIPQKMGGSRKNAADIKLTVDALELAFERSYVTTFVIGTGDSDFTPLVHKLRELDKRVIGFGISGSTSKLLPPACDEFLFYERLIGDDGGGHERAGRSREPSDDEETTAGSEPADVAVQVVRTLTGLVQASDGSTIRSSSLKRALLRKDPTFSEADHGYRAFGELLRALESEGVVELDGSGDPLVRLPDTSDAEASAMALLAEVIAESGSAQLSGLKDILKSRDRSFDERRLGYGGFLQFTKAARSRGLIELEWDDDASDYILTVNA
jgi:uncharacterized LabA/DUF88 family protein